MAIGVGVSYVDDKSKGNLYRVVRRPSLLYRRAAVLGLTNWVSDEIHLRLMYRSHFGRTLNLNDPQTFNEKLQWLKLHDRNPLYTTLVDKIAVKDWVANCIGAEYVTRTYAVWDDVDDIHLEDLPDRFVLKVSHDSGGIAICRNRAEFDFDVAKERLSESLSHNYFWQSREWPYKNVEPRVFAEEYLEPDSVAGDLMDYKCFVFGGQVRCIDVDYDRFTDHHRVFYSPEWEKMSFANRYPSDPQKEIPRPARLGEMISIAEKLAEKAGRPAHVRVDFFTDAERLRFGEMTFFHEGGFGRFCPDSWDALMGSWIDLKRL